MKTILTPQGMVPLTISQKYRVEDILDLDDATAKTFASILRLGETSSRYQILYSLALNDLLIVSSGDLNEAFRNLSLGSNSLEWVQKNRQTLMTMEQIVSEGANFKIPLYGLTFAGKRSGLFHLISSMSAEHKISDSFERSFHVSPNKFTSERINDHESVRSKIRSAIESNFTLNDAMIERTFNLIDQTYFSGILKYRLQAAGKRISFRVSHQMIKTAGSMTSKHTEKEYVIAIAAKLNEVLGNRLSSGISVNGPVDAFIVTLQHEITHLIVHLEMDRLGIDPNDKSDQFKSHGTLFKDIGERFFGLTERTHRLFEAESDEEATVDKSQLAVGMRVYFNHKDTRMYGTITKLNPKRAKVDTGGGNGYSVPYQSLHTA